ncbi:putative thioredoxin, partial [Cercophora newfieldiana]
NKLVLLDFFAVWCGPCKAIALFVADLSSKDKYKDAYFGKIEIDVLSSLSDGLDVQAMPTILLFRDGMGIVKVVEPTPTALPKLPDEGLRGKKIEVESAR